MAALSNVSAVDLPGQWISISGSTIGIKSAAMICLAISNCWLTMFLMLAGLVICGRLSLDLPVHGVFEEDCANNPFAAEAEAGYDARPHLMHEIEHFNGNVGIIRSPVRAIVLPDQQPGFGFEPSRPKSPTRLTQRSPV